MEKLYLLLSVLLAASVVCSVMAADDTEEEAEPDTAQVEYAKGSVCQYCEYCKFCKLCDEQCPCEIGPGRPACHMCKYCTYCKFCGVCDTICLPGGIIDKVTGALVSSLPSGINHEDVDKEIAGVKTHIDKTKEDFKTEEERKTKEEL